MKKKTDREREYGRSATVKRTSEMSGRNEKTGYRGKGSDREITDIDHIKRLEKQIEELPSGYISRKIINGKERLYLQWREGSKVRSRYIKNAEKEEMLQKISMRKALQRELETVTGRIREEHHPGMVAEPQQIYYYGQRSAPVKWMKWKDTVIGEIDADCNVRFTRPDFNDTVRSYTHGKTCWTRDELTAFLDERIVSSSRRDIEKILYRCGLMEYDTLKIGMITKGICARDLMWIASAEDELFSDAITEVFESVFHQKVDLQGDSIDTPEGQNIKRYGVHGGHYGIFKKRLSPLTSDIESELAAAELALRAGIPCCPCVRVDQDTVFSRFCYDFANEYIVHFRRLITQRGSSDEIENMIAVRPQYIADIARMTAFDFVTRQDDRHLSNIAVKINGEGESFYPLYDNGRSLFYEDTEETVKKACGDVHAFATAFGPEGSYYDHVKHLSEMGISFRKLMDLNIREHEISDILERSGFSGYRLKGACSWIISCLEELRSLG